MAGAGDDDPDENENVQQRRGHSRSSSPSRPEVKPLLLLVALVSLAWSLYQLPLNRVIERRLCGEYYRERGGTEGDGEIPEERCKVDEVQRGLGRIQGVMETGWVVGGMFTAFLFLFIAGRRGCVVVMGG